MPIPPTRQSEYTRLFPKEPSFRWVQIEKALFQPDVKGWEGVSTLPKLVRGQCENDIPWMSLREHLLVSTPNHETYKAALKTQDNHLLETVLMLNRRGQWTMCMSSQIGCAMRCSFCATGQIGFTRNLTVDEIVDQYRYWNSYLQNQRDFSGSVIARSRATKQSTIIVDRHAPDGSLAMTKLPIQRISNIVVMGMGEPLANYDAVRQALRMLLEFTDVGPTHITVSTVGMLPQMEKLIKDKEWPPVRIAVSLHSADEQTRKSLMPSSYDGFLVALATWCRDYLRLCGNRRHHLTFEYVLIEGVNDDIKQATKLAKYVNSIGDIKVNLIPYNATNTPYKRAEEHQLNTFLLELHNRGIIATIRRSMGSEISAACGQLASLKSSLPLGRELE